MGLGMICGAWIGFALIQTDAALCFALGVSLALAGKWLERWIGASA